MTIQPFVHLSCSLGNAHSDGRNGFVGKWNVIIDVLSPETLHHVVIAAVSDPDSYYRPSRSAVYIRRTTFCSSALLDASKLELVVPYVIVGGHYNFVLLDAHWIRERRCCKRKVRVTCVGGLVAWHMYLARSVAPLQLRLNNL